MTYIYLDPKWPLFLKVNPPKEGLFQSKQLGSRYIYPWKLTAGSSKIHPNWKGKSAIFAFQPLIFQGERGRVNKNTHLASNEIPKSLIVLHPTEISTPLALFGKIRPKPFTKKKTPPFSPQPLFPQTPDPQNSPFSTSLPNLFFPVSFRISRSRPPSLFQDHPNLHLPLLPAHQACRLSKAPYDVRKSHGAKGHQLDPKVVWWRAILHQFHLS